MVAAANISAVACSTPMPARFPPIAFNSPPIRLKVGHVVLADTFHPNNNAHEVDQLFPLPLDRAAGEWAAQHLVAASPSSPLTARFTVTDGRAVAVPPPSNSVAPTEALLLGRCDAGVAATLEIVDGDGRRLASVNLEAADSGSVSETATPEDRRRAWYLLTKGVMNGFDSDAASRIPDELGDYVE